VASRRAADALIASGSVRVNSKRPPAAGLMIEPEEDVVTVDGHRVAPPSTHRYLMLNKPLGTITTARDEASRRTVLDVVGNEGKAGHRVFPVGRLDADTTGLLLLTDDGDLSYRLTHPPYKVPKEYVATVSGSPSARDVQNLRRGVELDDGPTAPAEVEILRALPHQTDLRVTIREGRHRQVRRMFQAVGHKTVALRRVAFGPLRLGRLGPGESRVLSAREVSALRRAAGLESG